MRNTNQQRVRYMLMANESNKIVKTGSYKKYWRQRWWPIEHGSECSLSTFKKLLLLQHASCADAFRCQEGLELLCCSSRQLTVTGALMKTQQPDAFCTIGAKRCSNGSPDIFPRPSLQPVGSV